MQEAPPSDETEDQKENRIRDGWKRYGYSVKKLTGVYRDGYYLSQDTTNKVRYPPSFQGYYGCSLDELEKLLEDMTNGLCCWRPV